MNATLDQDGNVWMADMFNITRTVAKYDWRTGQATNYVVSETPGGPPANSHDIIVDNDGIVWFDMSSMGALGRIDPRTDTSEIIRPPEGARVGPSMDSFQESDPECLQLRNDWRWQWLVVDRKSSGWVDEGGA